MLSGEDVFASGRALSYACEWPAETGSALKRILVLMLSVSGSA